MPSRRMSRAARPCSDRARSLASTPRRRSPSARSIRRHKARRSPAQNYLNWGWALTPQPGMIPTDGSTIQVIVDGAPVGNVTYNLFRPDVSGAFPGLANTAGPVGYRAIDTTALAEGLHTVSWTVTDTRPATSGIGSRYFHRGQLRGRPAAQGRGVSRADLRHRVNRRSRLPH